jgi:hypothetical protein
MFELRRFDAGWQVSTLGQPSQAPEPEPAGQDIGALLEAAEDIVNSAAPDILAEFEAKESKSRFRRRKKRK